MHHGNSNSSRAESSSLLDACCFSDLNTIKKILRDGCPATSIVGSTTIIDQACAYHDVSVVKCLLEFDSTLIKSHNPNGWTPAHTASLFGRVDIVELLIKRGVKNNKDWKCHGKTPIDVAKQQLDNFKKQSSKSRVSDASKEDYKKIIEMWSHPDKIIEADKKTGELAKPKVDVPLPSPRESAWNKRPDLRAVSFATKDTAKQDKQHDVCTDAKESEQKSKSIDAGLPKDLTVFEIIQCGTRVSSLLKQYSCSSAALIRCLILQDPQQLRVEIDDMPCLHYAVLEADVEVVKVLMDIDDIDANIENKKGFTALQEAAAKDRDKVLQVLVDSKKIHINYRSTNNGMTALHSAARYGHVKSVQILLNAGADPCKCSTSSWTPKNSAEKSLQDLRSQQKHSTKHETVIKILEKAEKDPYAQNFTRYRNWLEHQSFSDLEMAFFDAIEIHNDQGIAELFKLYHGVLIAQIDGFSTLHVAASYNNVYVLNFLKEKYSGSHEFPINKIGGDNKQTPLHVAAVSGCVEAVKWLLENSADSEIPNKNGFSSLHEAAAKGFNEVVQVILNHGANVNLLSSGFPVLFSAARYGHFQVVQTLIERGARLDLTGPYGQSILDYTISAALLDIHRRSSHYKIIEFFLKEKKLSYKRIPTHLRKDIKDLLDQYGKQKEKETTSDTTVVMPEEDVCSKYKPEDSPLLKRLLKTYSEESYFRAVRCKPGGSNPGAIYEKTDDSSHWVGKMGYDVLSKTDPCAQGMRSRTRTEVGLKLDAVKEKRGMDLYTVLVSEVGTGSCEIPETNLAILPVQERLILKDSNYKSKIDSTFSSYNITDTIFVMSRWYDRFTPLGDFKTFKKSIEAGIIPENIDYNEQTISTEPLICLLAHARVLGDIDVFGIGLSNVGLNPNETGTFSCWIKVDGTHVFQGSSRDDYINSKKYSYLIEEKTGDLRNIQYNATNWDACVIEWNKLTGKQKEIYIAELDKAIALCKNKNFLDFLFKRQGLFLQYGVNEEQLDLTILRWQKQWIELQEKVYAIELREYRLSHFETTNLWLTKRLQSLGLLTSSAEFISDNSQDRTVANLSLSVEKEGGLAGPNTVPKVPRTRIEEILLDDFKKSWDQHKCWPPKQIKDLILKRCNGDKDKALRIVGGMTATARSRLIQLLKEKGVSKKELKSYEGRTIGVILDSYNDKLSEKIYEEKPFFNLMRLLGNDGRHNELFPESDSPITSSQQVENPTCFQSNSVVSDDQVTQSMSSERMNASVDVMVSETGAATSVGEPEIVTDDESEAVLQKRTTSFFEDEKIVHKTGLFWRKLEVPKTGHRMIPGSDFKDAEQRESFRLKMASYHYSIEKIKKRDNQYFVVKLGTMKVTP